MYRAWCVGQWQTKALVMGVLSVTCLLISIKFIYHRPPPDFYDEFWCNVDCPVGKPCEYRDEVDFRIIVMTFDRPNSLQKCLQAIGQVDTLGKMISVEVWIDRSTEGQIIDQIALQSAEEFKAKWTGGRVCIHKRESNAFIDGQWIDTWRPQAGSKEIGLILEDDVDISQHALRWLEAVHAHYDHVADIAGYTLQMQDTQFFKGRRRRLTGPVGDNVFLYGVLGTWGFSPHAQRWRDFQDWFHSKDPSIKPYVPDIVPDYWYHALEKKGKERSMWEMWHIYFSDANNFYTLYCNLHVKLSRQDVLLSFNRKEKGLHFKGETGQSGSNSLMSEWRPDYAEFPEKVVRYSYEGNEVEPIL